MATLTVNGDYFSNKVIVGIFIDSDGQIIASTNFRSDATFDIPNNHIGGTPEKSNPTPHLACDFTVTSVESEPKVQPKTVSILKTCYTKTGQPYPC